MNPPYSLDNKRYEIFGQNFPPGRLMNGVLVQYLGRIPFCEIKFKLI